jgi:hypothetical protein
MRTTREHGRTTRMLKIGRHNGAHAEVWEGTKGVEKPKNSEDEIVPLIHLYVFC